MTFGPNQTFRAAVPCLIFSFVHYNQISLYMQYIFVK